VIALLRREIIRCIDSIINFYVHTDTYKGVHTSKKLIYLSRMEEEPSWRCSVVCEQTELRQLEEGGVAATRLG